MSTSKRGFGISIIGLLMFSQSAFAEGDLQAAALQELNNWQEQQAVEIQLDGVVALHSMQQEVASFRTQRQSAEFLALQEQVKQMDPECREQMVAENRKVRSLETPDWRDLVPDLDAHSLFDVMIRGLELH
ncbi:MAG: hypothetical protein ACWA5Q_01480 [bacterium]